jgi:hypothetical protein
MNEIPYLSRIATARLARPATTSRDAYAQVDRMAKSTSGPFTTKVSDVSSVGRKKRAVSLKGSGRYKKAAESMI